MRMPVLSRSKIVRGDFGDVTQRLLAEKSVMLHTDCVFRMTDVSLREQSQICCSSEKKD